MIALPHGQPVLNFTNINAGNMGMAQTNANNSAGMLGGLMNGAGGAISKLFNKGGVVETKDATPMPPHLEHIAHLYHGGVAKMAYGGTAAPGAAPANSAPSEFINNISQLKPRSRATPRRSRGSSSRRLPPRRPTSR